MTAPITGMYCDRCGARHDFARARPGGVARLRGLTRGVRGYVLNEAPTFNDAISDAWARLEEDGALEQDAEVQQTFSFCLDCRGYVCHECWNAEAGRCLTCVPLPGTEDQAGSLLAGRLDLVAGPAAAPAMAAPAGDVAPPSVAEPAHAAPPAPVAEPAHAAPPDAGDEAIDSVDAVARLAGMGLAGGEPIASVSATPPAGPAAAAEAGLTVDGPPADAGSSTATPVDGATAAAGTRRPPRLHRHVRASAPAGVPVPSDEDADVIAAAVAAGIIVSPTPPPPSAPPDEPPAQAAVAEPVPAAPVAEVVAASGEAAVATAEIEASVGAAAGVEAAPEVVAAPAETDIAQVDAAHAWPTRTPAPTPPEVADAVEATAIAAPEPAAPERDLADEGPAAVPPEREPVAATGPATAPTGQTMATGGSATPGRPRGRDRRRPAPPPRRIPSPVHCRHCGLQVPAVARFCRRCGGRQVEDATVVG